MRDSAWNTAFGRLLIVVSVLSAIGGCVYASSVVRDEQNGSLATGNVDDNLTTTDMNATYMNATSNDAVAAAPSQEQSYGTPTDECDGGPCMNATDMNATDMNATDM